MESLSVSDPGINAEHTNTSYLWRASKRGQRVHIENPETERAYCQAENCSGGKSFDDRGAEIPPGRRLCQNCADLVGRNKVNYGEPSLAVLMGERLAETESELFYEGRGKWGASVPFGYASTVAAEAMEAEETGVASP